ncbi:MAG: hypothetical protein ABDH49_02405 [Candidatus Hydrothermales bacterium]
MIEARYYMVKYQEETILFNYFTSHKFYFSAHQISSSYTALKTKGFVILAGLSGTGKTKMAQIFANGFPKIDKKIRELIDKFAQKDKEITFRANDLFNKFKEKYYEKIKLKTLTLEEWHSSGSGLVYDLEFGEYKELGGIGGGAAEKFGIYCSENGKYVIAPQLKEQLERESIEDAFKYILDELNKLMLYAENRELEKIEKEIKVFWPIVRRKFTYLFNSDLLIPCYTDDDLKKILKFFKYEFKNFIDAQKKLKEIKEKIMPSVSNQTFANFIYSEDGLKKFWDKEEIEPVDLRKTCFFLPVQPDWKDLKSLLGYYNPIMNRFEEPTHFLRFILEAIIDYKENRNRALPYFVIPDEMNLARVEYYFAEFLSVLESGRDEDGFTKEGIKIQISGKDIDKQKEEQKGLSELLEKAGYNPRENVIDLKFPPNLYFIGTINIDETTFMFSPKVLDRAFVIEFKEVDFDEYKENLEKEGELMTEVSEIVKDDFISNGEFLRAYADKNKIKEAIEEFPYFESLKNLSQITLALRSSLWLSCFR